MKRITPEEAAALAGFRAENAAFYPVFWHHERTGVVGLHRLLFHWTCHMGMDWIGHTTSYCYAARDLAERAMDEWDPATEPDPKWWHKHPDSGRRQDQFEFNGVILHIQNGQIANVTVPEEAAS